MHLLQVLAIWPLLLFIQAERGSSASSPAPDMPAKLLCELLCEHCNGVPTMEEGQCLCEIPASYFKDNVACLDRVRLSAAEMKLPLNYTAKIGDRRRRCADPDQDGVQPATTESLDAERLKSPSSTSGWRLNNRDAPTLPSHPGLGLLKFIKFQSPFVKSWEGEERTITKRDIAQHGDIRNNLPPEVVASKPELNPLTPRDSVSKCVEESNTTNTNKVEPSKLSSRDVKHSLNDNLNPLLEKNSPAQMKVGDGKLSEAKGGVQADSLEAEGLENIRARFDSLATDKKLLSTSKTPLNLNDIIKRQELRVSETNLSNLNKVNEMKMRLKNMFSSSRARESGLPTENMKTYFPMKLEGSFHVKASPVELEDVENNAIVDEIQGTNTFRANQQTLDLDLKNKFRANKLKLSEILRNSKPNLSLDQLTRNFTEIILPKMRNRIAALQPPPSPLERWAAEKNRDSLRSNQNCDRPTVRAHADSNVDLNAKHNAISSLKHSDQVSSNEPRNNNQGGPVILSTGRNSPQNLLGDSVKPSDNSFGKHTSKMDEDANKNINFVALNKKLENTFQPKVKTKLEEHVDLEKPTEHEVISKPIVNAVFTEREKQGMHLNIPNIKLSPKDISPEPNHSQDQVGKDKRPNTENQIVEKSKSSSNLKSFLNPGMKTVQDLPNNLAPLKTTGPSETNNLSSGDKIEPPVSLSSPKMRNMELTENKMDVNSMENLHKSGIVVDIPGSRKQVEEAHIPNTESTESRPNVDSEAKDNPDDTFTQVNKHNGLLLDRLGVASKTKAMNQHENGQRTHLLPRYMMPFIRNPSVSQPLPLEYVQTMPRIDHVYTPPGYGDLYHPSYAHFPESHQIVDYAGHSSSPVRVGQGGPTGHDQPKPSSGTFLLPHPVHPGMFVLKPLGHDPPVAQAQYLGSGNQGQAIVEIHPIPYRR